MQPNQQDNNSDWNNQQSDQPNWQNDNRPDQDQHNSHNNHHSGQNQHNQHHPNHNNQHQQNQHNQNSQQPDGYQQNSYNQPNNNYPNQPYDNQQPVNNQPQGAQTHQSNPGNIILQWLTYAFWGWTILAMSVLTGIVFYSFFGEEDTGSFSIYVIAAVLVLLPISAVCDKIYSKQEPAKKQGGESIVMVIHAVIFALFGIGAVISTVFAVVMLITSSGESTGSKVTLFSGLIIALLYLAAFARTLDLPALKIVKKHFTKFMILAVGIILLFGIIGPVAKSRATRDDRLITTNFYKIEQEIADYARENDDLPQNLNELSLSGDAKIVIDRNLLEYTPNTKEPVRASSDDDSEFSYNRSDTFYYSLCANFKEAKTDKYGYSYNSGYSGDDGYTTYVSLNEYSAGKNCYKIKTTSY